MPEQVTSQLDITRLDSPDGDAWADFRTIERIQLELTQRYNYSLGKVSRFFVELENRRFFATACEKCGRVYAPPRPLCPACLRPTKWRELPGTGRLETWSLLHFSPGTNDDVAALETPYALAYVLLDGASTLFPHLLRAAGETLARGMRVKVTYADAPVSHPIHLMYFVPATPLGPPHRHGGRLIPSGDRWGEPPARPYPTPER